MNKEKTYPDTFSYDRTTKEIDIPDRKFIVPEAYGEPETVTGVGAFDDKHILVKRERREGKWREGEWVLPLSCVAYADLPVPGEDGLVRILDKNIVNGRYKPSSPEEIAEAKRILMGEAKPTDPKECYAPKLGDRIALEGEVDGFDDDHGYLRIQIDGGDECLLLPKENVSRIRLLHRPEPKPKRKVTLAEVSEMFGEEVEIISENS